MSREQVLDELLIFQTDTIKYVKCNNCNNELTYLTQKGEFIIELPINYPDEPMFVKITNKNKQMNILSSVNNYILLKSPTVKKIMKKIDKLLCKVKVVNTVDEYLHFDIRESEKSEIDVFSQLKEKVSLKDVYDILFGLDYIGPEYHLTWGEKEISQLSPGERGTLLLIFYLCIDRDNIPLVVDQPEENLDNQRFL